MTSPRVYTLGAVMAGALGAAAVVWVLLGGVGHHPLALAMTLGIGAVYAVGLAELWRFHRDTRALSGAVSGLQAHTPLPAWLDALPAGLRQPVRRRIAGAAAPLPGPALTPYLVGLLVLLGMLGTFLGLVVTLDGTVAALERTTDLAAMRAALAAPVKGLGLAFGTSVAGVAASAMLGLASALLRRVRGGVQQALDRQAATVLQDATPAAQRARQVEDLARTLTDQLASRLEAAMQAQAAALTTHLPGLVDQVQTLLTRLDTQQQARQQQEQAQQAAFQREMHAQFEALATRVGTTLETTLGTRVAQALRDSLADGAQAAGTALQAATAAAVDGIARESAAVQARLADSTQAQLQALGDLTQRHLQAMAERTQAQAHALEERANAQVQTLVDGTQTALQTLAQRFESTAEQIGQALQQQAATLADGVALAHTTLQERADTRDAQRQAESTAALQALASTLQQQAADASAAAQAQQTAWSEALAQRTEALQQQAATQARDIVAEVARLTTAAAEAPRAAAAVIAEMREQLGASQARDAALLDERVRLTEALATLVDDSRRAAAAQQAAVQGLVDAADGLVQRSSEAVVQHWQAALAQQGDAATRLAGGAVEVASLGEAFGAAVTQFADTAGTLAAQLQRVESALDQAAVRHDEQLAYYVAQAREVIDLSLGAQQPLLDAMPPLLAALQRIAGPVATADTATAETVDAR
ncbi:MAG: hypothetical protein H6932_09420 [Burkholderiaceae bacterium]|nr:hypothetical protein [Burkholderiaceae bacterium]